jgi:hypothetical protein
VGRSPGPGLPSEPGRHNLDAIGLGPVRASAGYFFFHILFCFKISKIRIEFQNLEEIHKNTKGIPLGSF